MKISLLMISLVVLHTGFVALAQSSVKFNKARCLQLMPAGYSALCDLHEEQFTAPNFRSDAIVGYSYTSCHKYTGELSRQSTVAVPCVSYFVGSELKKEIALKSVFGLTPKYPLSYKGLLIHFSVYPPQAQYGHGSATNVQMTGPSGSGQIGDSVTTRQYGYTPKKSMDQMGDGQGSSRNQQMQ